MRLIGITFHACALYLEGHILFQEAFHVDRAILCRLLEQPMHAQRDEMINLDDVPNSRCASLRAKLILLEAFLPANVRRGIHDIMIHAFCCGFACCLRHACLLWSCGDGCADVDPHLRQDVVMIFEILLVERMHAFADNVGDGAHLGTRTHMYIRHLCKQCTYTHGHAPFPDMQAIYERKHVQHGFNILKSPM